MKVSSRMEFAVNLATKCGEILKDIVKNQITLDREQKGVNDFVTAADKTIEEYVFKSIREYFPDDSIRSEEGNNFEKGGIQWIIDPLDGTTNFYFGYPAYCVSIAYKDEKGVLGGVVQQPLLNELFTAEKSMGAFLNGQPINVNNFRDPSENLIVMGFANRKRELWNDYAKIYTNVMPNVIDIRRTGSAALDLCYVACGRFGAYYEPAVKVWDIAAGSLIVTEAGGNITDRNGMYIDFCEENYSILATNGLLHDWFLNNTKQE